MFQTKIHKGLKVLEVGSDYFIGAKGYCLYKYSAPDYKPNAYGKVNDKFAIFSKNKFSRRLLRAEITKLYSLEDGSALIIAKKGIFRKEADSRKFNKVFDITRGSRPLNLCITPEGTIYWGEYFSNMEKDAVNIYESKDGGRAWKVVYTFPKGEINHVHGLFWDEFTKSIWIATGDRENECIIGCTKDGFKNLNIVFRGGQEYRATILLFYKDFICFGTDSQYIQNKIKVIDRKSLRIREVQNIQGSAIKGGQYGNFSYISTTVEPSEINKDLCSHLWVSNDGLNWKEIFAAEKDIYPAILQFGSIEFPAYTSPIKNAFMFSGRALKGIDGNSMSIPFD